METARRGAAVGVALSLIVFASGCGSTRGDSADASVAAGGDGAVLDAHASTGHQGDHCTIGTECVEPSAICRQGGICTGTLGADAFARECATGGAAACPGQLCITLLPNVQGKTGICSMPCDADPGSCGSGAACVAMGTHHVCLHVCAATDDCPNGFACVDNPTGIGRGCFAEPVSM